MTIPNHRKYHASCSMKVIVHSFGLPYSTAIRTEEDLECKVRDLSLAMLEI
jgi:hypothetical protein